ncbi:ornithine carbamoyltransferase [Haloarculaceae archaeon H-GB2-1]|nr:ornithine carbamoyltransferase [Haloarculaceae archaeon H-GB1-1]MEA5388687.1 ornithine carbamoyltransferase [Haloarculaceae archaeon H-GB11]MEA5406743.1 ornithine carbamoyltransferase [Haloarculaceae archaeon H-GB2-1]
MPRNFLDVDDLTPAELIEVLDLAADIKAGYQAGEADRRYPNDTLAMVFEKPSTRTRVSFETGMTQLGGHAIFLGPNDIQLSRGEPIKDTARAIARYADVIMARLFDHDDAEEMAEYATVPVINGLTDDAHPCQTLADLLTIREHFGGFDRSVAWVGDGNNVAQSFVVGAAMAGLDLTVATPEGYGIDDDVLDRAREFGGEPTVTNDPEEAVEDARVVYTDVWVSMGEEDERDQKLGAFDGFQVDADLLGDRKFMHCLPAHRGDEVTDEVMESDDAIVWDQAENRLHAQKGLLAWLAEQ